MSDSPLQCFSCLYNSILYPVTACHTMSDDTLELECLLHALDFTCDQALELCEEVSKQLGGQSRFEESFSLDEEPNDVVKKPTGVEAWFQPVPAAAPTSSWMRLQLEMAGVAVRKANCDVRFASKKGFNTKLTMEPTPGWILEQLLVAKHETELAIEALKRAKVLRFHGGDGRERLVELGQLLDRALTALNRAQNAFLMPNPLGFPSRLRPFNGFVPALSREFLLEFSVFRDRLFVSAFRIAVFPPSMVASAAGSVVGMVNLNGVVPDVWFEEGPSESLRWKDLSFTFEGGQVVRVLEQYSASFQVALFTKILVFLGDAQRVLGDYRANVVAMNSLRYPELPSKPHQYEDDCELIQPGYSVTEGGTSPRSSSPR